MLKNRRRNKQNNNKKNVKKSPWEKVENENYYPFFYVKSEEKAHNYCGKYNVNKKSSNNSQLKSLLTFAK